MDQSNLLKRLTTSQLRSDRFSTWVASNVRRLRRSAAALSSFAVAAARGRPFSNLFAQSFIVSITSDDVSPRFGEAAKRAEQ